MTAKKHYDEHLGDFYSWMVGDFEVKQKEHQQFLVECGISPNSNKVALDLGAGNGIQSVSLAELGFKVKAIDFNNQLLSQLAVNGRDLPVEIIADDIRSFKTHAEPKPELIICWGDTLAHLESLQEIEKLIADAAETLTDRGKLILSFRDYSNALTGDKRFIPVRADEEKILTCCLDFEDERVRVTDILHDKTETGWLQKVSSYYKVRVHPKDIENIIRQNGFKIEFNELVNRMNTIVAVK